MRKLMFVVSCVSCALGIGESTARAEDTSSIKLEEIVVTAQRREESLQRTPVAISVVTGEELRNANVARAEDLTLIAPSVHIVDTGTQSLVRIRGVGTNTQTALQNSQIAFSIDGVFNSANTAGDAGLFDLERVEIVKGPQGTLYGKNATGGAFNLITAKPKNSFEANVGVDFGNYNKIQTNGMLNLPLSDSLAMRAAFQTVKHDGYLSSGYNDADDQAGRLQFLFKPDDRLSVLLSGNYYKKGGMGFNYVPLNPVNNAYQNPNNPWQDSPAGSILSQADEARCVDSLTSNATGNAFPYCSDRSGHTNNQIWSVNAQLDYRFDFATLTVIPAYISNRSDVLIFPRWLYLSIDSDNPQKTLEARLASNNSDARLQWLFGVYTSDSKNDVKQVIYQPVVRPTFTPFALYPNTDYLNLTDKSYAAFTQETLSITQALRVTAGVRYTKEDQTKGGNYYTVLGTTEVGQPATTAAACAALAGSGAAFNGTNCVIPEVGSLNEHAVNYRAGLEYDLSPSSLLYTNVSTGFHAGGFFQGLPPDTFKPEKLTAYALGTKNRFLNDSLQINAEAYYWDYKDLQYTSTALINPAINGAVTVNAGKAKIYGVDLDMQYRVTAQDQVSLAVDIAKGENTDFTFAASRPPPTGSVCIYNATARIEDCSGTDLISLPKISGNFGYQHSFNLADNATLNAALTTHFESASWLFYDQLSAQRQKAYNLSNFDLTYASAKHWSVGGYVRNIENKAIKTFAQTGSLTTMGTPFVSLNAPRTYGLKIQASF